MEKFPYNPKEDVSPACFARLVKAYYQSVCHVTFPFLAYSSGEFFNAMEIVEGNCAPFSSSNLLYIHCIDLNVKFEYSFSGIASLNLITALGHVSFPSDLRSRRLVLFLCSKEMFDSLGNKKSPVVCRVKASCFFEVSQLIVFLFVRFCVFRDKYVAMCFVAFVHRNNYSCTNFSLLLSLLHPCSSLNAKSIPKYPHTTYLLIFLYQSLFGNI